MIIFYRIYENGRKKCFEYWPEEDGDKIVYDKLTIERESTIEQEHYLLHKHKVWFDEESVRRVILPQIQIVYLLYICLDLKMYVMYLILVMLSLLYYNGIS